MRVLVGALCAVMLGGCSGEADFSGLIPVVTLEAEKFQQEIASIDRLLFTTTPLGEEGVRALENAFSGLAERVAAEQPGSTFLKEQSLELKLLAKRAGRLSRGDTGAKFQNDWMRIRNNLFDDRHWFVRSAADLEYAASVVRAAPTPVAPSTPAATSPPVATPSPGPALPDPAPAMPVAEPRLSLSGRWRVASILADGELRTDPEITGSVLSFDSPRLIMREISGKETVYEFAPEGDYLALVGASGESGWMKYRLSEAGLRIAFFDNLRGKPRSFEPESPRGDPMLLVIDLVPIP